MELRTRRLNLRGINKNSLIFLGIIVLSLIAIFFLIGSKLKSPSPISGQKTQVKDAKAVTGINQEFSFPLKDDKGKEVSRIKFFIENAEIRDEIIVRGQKATSARGRTFLILNLKLTNDLNQSVEINTKDYLRLGLSSKENEWLAPDIHNDPVSVQAISTKYTRVGFAVNEGEKSFKLQIGEINGEKVVLDINL